MKKTFKTNRSIWYVIAMPGKKWTEERKTLWILPEIKHELDRVRSHLEQKNNYQNFSFEKAIAHLCKLYWRETP